MCHSGYAGINYYLLDDAELRAAFADDIGKVAFTHHWPLQDLLDSKKLSQKTSGGPGWLPREWTVDLVKLACLLRTADAAHADDRRAPEFLAALRQPAGVSDPHWRFQSLLRTPRGVEDDRIRYHSNRPFNADEIDAWWVAYDWLHMVDRELWSVDSLLADTDRPRFAAKGVWNTEDPLRLVQDLQTNGWEPADIKIRVGDISHLVRMLGGTQLYGNRPEVPLRELIQNSADAIRARRKLQNREPSFGRIVVRPGRDAAANQDWIEVQDDGVGMSKDVLTDVLLDFGAEFWGTGRMRREFPGLEAAGMEATGQFGIGFFSVFMWRDRVQVATRRFNRAYDDTWVLEFRRGVELRPLLRKATLEEQQSLPDGGTRVRVWCESSRQIPASILRRQPPSTSSCTWEELCEWLAPALDVDLSVEVDGIIRPTVRANDWLSIDVESMLLRINRKGSEDLINAIIQRRAEWRTITSCLGVVRDDSGRPVARGTVWTFEPERFSASVAVCGGLRTDGGGNFLGIRFGKPKTAARHLAVSDDQMAGWVAWAEEQRRCDEPCRFQMMARAMAAIRLCAFIAPHGMPIGYSHAGWVTLDQFATIIRSAPAFQCIGSSLGAAPNLLQNFGSMPSIVVSEHHLLNQLDGGVFAIVRLLRAAAAEQWRSDCEVSDLNQGLRSLVIDGQLATYHIMTFSRRIGRGE